MKFSIKDFFSKCDQIRRKLRVWSYLLMKSLTENFIFCAVKLAFACYKQLASNWLFKLNNKYTKPANLLREDSIADVFLWILKSFQEQLEQVQVTVSHKVKNKI